MSALKVHMKLSVLDNHSVLSFERLSYEGAIAAARPAPRTGDARRSQHPKTLPPPTARTRLVRHGRKSRGVPAHARRDPSASRSFRESASQHRSPGAGGDVGAAVRVIYRRGQELRAAASKALQIAACRIHESLNEDAKQRVQAPVPPSERRPDARESYQPSL